MDAVWGAINIGEVAGWPSQLRSLGLWMLFGVPSISVELAKSA